MVFAEDRLSYRLAVELADRIFETDHEAWWAAQEDWNGIKESVRVWGPIKPGHHKGERTTRGDLKREELRLTSIDVDDKMAAIMLKATKLAAIRARELRPRRAVLVAAIDSDGLEHRRAAFQKVLSTEKQLLAALAIPHPESEAWVLSGFFPANLAEEKRLTRLTKQLRFDPTLESHRLRSTTSDERDTKRCFFVLAEDVLSENNAKDKVAEEGGRGERCWLDTELSILETRGKQNGLADYLEDVRARLLPLLKGGA